MSEVTPMAAPFVSQKAQHNRQAITELMARHGFVAYPWEFWHYSSGDVYADLLSAGQARARYGPVDWRPDTHVVSAIGNPAAPLLRHQDIAAVIEPLMKGII